KEGDGTARFEIDPAEAEIARQVFEWFVRDRLPIRQICKRLNARGAKTRQGKERWAIRLIWGILGQPASCGRAYYGRHKVGGQRPPSQARKRMGGQRPGEHALWAAGVRARSGSVYRHPPPPQDWIEVAIPALVDEATVEAARAQLEENRRRSRVGPGGPRHLL